MAERWKFGVCSISFDFYSSITLGWRVDIPSCFPPQVNVALEHKANRAALDEVDEAVRAFGEARLGEIEARQKEMGRDILLRASMKDVLSMLEDKVWGVTAARNQHIGPWPILKSVVTISGT